MSLNYQHHYLCSVNKVSESRFFNFSDQCKVFVHAKGKGEAVLCLHGFDRDGSDFMAFPENFYKHYQVLAVDYFAHGKSDNFKGKVSKKEYADFLIRILNFYGQEKVHLVAYSMGGRLALSMIETEKLNIQSITFLAIDGIEVNYWQRKSGSWWGKFMYKQIVLKRPKTFFKIVDWMYKKRWLAKAQKKFVDFQLRDEKGRKLVYKISKNSSRLYPSTKKVSGILEKKNPPCELVWGKHDKIVPYPLANKFQNEIYPDADLITLDCGHLVIDENWLIKTQLYRNTQDNTAVSSM